MGLKIFFATYTEYLIKDCGVICEVSNIIHFIFGKFLGAVFLQGTTAIGNPLRVENLGDTQVPYSVYIDYLKGLSETAYA